jgi:hypothetical protein
MIRISESLYGSVISKFESYQATTVRLSEIQSALTPTPNPSPQGGGERVSIRSER